MAKICFPHHNRGKFRSLKSALKYLGAETYSLSRGALRDIVMCSPDYRQYLRCYGIDQLIAHLIEEAPKLEKEPVLLRCLRRWAEDNPLANYDIRCYNITDKVTISGRKFNGLKDIREYVELCGRKCCDGLHYWSPIFAQSYEDVHVGELYEDGTASETASDYDIIDSRSYIFRSQPITNKDLNIALSAPHHMGFLLTHEQIPEESLPMLYYPGEDNYMFLVTKSE